MVQGRGGEEMISMKRVVAEWISDLPRDREFSLEWSYQQFRERYPKQVPVKAMLSRFITSTGNFDRWREPQGAVMFKFKGDRS